MKTLILLLFPLFTLCQQRDTFPAIIKLQKGNYSTNVKGYVVLTPSCKVVEYLRIKQKWFSRKYQLLPFPRRFYVSDYRLITRVGSLGIESLHSKGRRTK